MRDLTPIDPRELRAHAAVLRWLRGWEEDAEAWASTLGRLRWLARKDSDVSKAVDEILDARHRPPKPWPFVLGMDPATRRRRKERKRLDRVERALGRRPTRAVITVPAYFGDLQRQATRDAGELAGLAVERLVNEPTAAALTCRSDVEQRVLVYDLGGGTFDVSVLDRDEGFLEVRSSHGDTHLGGDDVDRALVELVLSRLPGRDASAVRGDPHALTRLEDALCRAKIALSERAPPARQIRRRGSGTRAR